MSYDTSDPTLPPPPQQSPLPPPPAQKGRLVRDPYSRLGGVASGLAHHYGIDVSLVRIVFVLTAFATGFGFLAYLLAWMVIPRADYWPPVGSTGSVRNLSGRELGIGLAIVGLLVALSFGSSGPGSILLPLALVDGGVWLLVQTPKEARVGTSSAPTTTATTSDATAGAATGPADDPFGPPVEPAFDTASYSGTYDSSQGYASPGPAPAPVPPRSRGRRLGILAAIGAAILALLAIPALLIGGLIFAVANGDLDIDFDAEQVSVLPTAFADLPSAPIMADSAEVVIDLTGLDAADFAGEDEPFDIRANVDFGSITVIVPEDLTVSIDASTDVGQVTAFGQSDDGFGNTIVIDEESADIDLDLDLDFGEITVERG